MSYLYSALSVIFGILAVFVSIPSLDANHNGGLVVIGLGIVSLGFAISSALLKKSD